MWHNPNQRLRAIANAKKREREKLRRPFHVKRIIAHLVLPTLEQPPSEASSNVAPSKATHSSEAQPNEPIPVRVILNDLSSKGVGLFSPFPFVPGQEVVITITAPFNLQIPSRIIWCQQHDANSHVLSSQPYSYRLGVEFVYPNQEKQDSMKILPTSTATAL